MTAEEKAKRVRDLAAQMAEVLQDGPEVCCAAVRLIDGRVTAVQAQMANPHGDSLEALGSVQTEAPFYSEAYKTWYQYRCVNVGGIEFWANAAIPAPAEEVPA